MPDLTFGQMVRDARTTRGSTLEGIGKAIGADHARVSRIERGHVRPTAREVHGLVLALGLDSDTALELAAKVDPRAVDDAPLAPPDPAPALEGA